MAESIRQSQLSLGQRIADALRQFAKQLESGERIPCTHVTIEHTPDGPLTTRRNGYLLEDETRSSE